jgi:predicted HicB family RNase H-like nuclease
MANHPTYGEPRRSIRISDELWQAALATAAERKESVPDVVRRALERYVARHRKETS